MVKPLIYYLIDIGENQLWEKFEAIWLSDNSKYFLVVDSRNIEDFGLAILMGHVRSLIEAHLWLNKAMRENLFLLLAEWGLLKIWELFHINRNVC